MQPGSFVIAVFEFVLLIFSLSVHECAHAWMASRLGDQTARLQGRVTLNPMYHVDPFGTLLFPGTHDLRASPERRSHGRIAFRVGQADPRHHPQLPKIVRDDTLTTLAGPVSNLLLAFLGFLGLAMIILVQGHLPTGQSMGSNVEALGLLCELAINVNLALFFFNLLPLPPLDGSRILRHFLPYNALNAYDKMGMLSFVLMIFLGGPIVRFLMGPTLGLVRMALRSL